jgi:carbon storage regulator CsrA
MLVLSRAVGEEIQISQDVRIVVISINGRHVRLGFTAPDSVRIRRREIVERELISNFSSARCRRDEAVAAVSILVESSEAPN